MKPEPVVFPFDAKCPQCGIAFHFETSSDHGWQVGDVARCPKCGTPLERMEPPA